MPALPNLLAFASLLALGCETPVPDPPPKASPVEIPVAPAGALGALAAGTDGAPKIVMQPEGLAPMPPPEHFHPSLPVPSPSAAPPAPSGGAESVPL